MAFGSVGALLRAAEEGKPLWEAVLDEDCRDRGVDKKDSWERVTALWTAMVRSVDEYDPGQRSASGLSGGQAAKMAAAEKTLCGPYMGRVMATALSVAERNACMGRIVAAPTAGASGVVPAVLIPLRARENLDDEAMVRCLYVAAGFGQVIATRASISGAEHGCQAEIGSASGMAAACAMALQNVMGLVCDPVGGLVEEPCVKRNVMGAVNAMAAADMALAGIASAIPCDDVIDAMAAVGRAMPAALRETGEGGLAATRTGRKIAQRTGGKPGV